MGLDENLFGFIFESATKSNKKTEDKFKAKIKTMSNSFEDAVTDMISDLVLNNLDYIAEIIIKNNPHKLATEHADVLKMLLASPKASSLLEAAKKQKRFIRWDTKTILETIIMLLADKGIVFSTEETRWLARSIHSVGQYLYSP